MTNEKCFRDALPFVDWSKGIVDVSLHRAVFLPQLLADQDFGCRARSSAFHTIAQDGMSAESFVVDRQIPDEECFLCSLCAARLTLYV